MSTCCKTHPDTQATGHCAGCAEPCCANCLVDMAGTTYCGSCKILALGGRTPMIEAATHPCPMAQEAMKMAIISFFCFGVILGPVAVGKAMDARRRIKEDPLLVGWGKANAAFVLGILAFIFSVLGFIQRMGGMNR